MIFTLCTHSRDTNPLTRDGPPDTNAQQRLIDAERRQTYGDLTDKEIAELEHNSVLQREENRALEEDRRKEQAKKPTSPPSRPEDAPETD